MRGKVYITCSLRRELCIVFQDTGLSAGVSRSMDREFLEDYEKKELQEINRFIKSVSEGRFSKTQRFPPDQRFRKLHDPVIYPGSMNMPIWPLVSFSGSTIIPLLPAEKGMFEKLHRFRVHEIDEIVSFAEETGKIQFVLMRKPTDYHELDFLNPIFERLKPPQFIGMPLKEFASHDVLTKYGVEFSTLVNLGFSNYVRRTSSYASRTDLFETYMTNLQGNYIMIKAVASSDICKDLEDALVTDYERAMELILLMDVLILRPLRNPLRCTESYVLETLKKAHQFANKHKIKMQAKPFPCEIGRLLMHKLTRYPESLEACKQLAAQYDEQDVHKLINAINEGILRDQPDVVEKNEDELSIVLDNIWADKSLHRGITGIKFGVPLFLGAVGTIAAGLSGSYVGLLAGIGFDVVDKILELKEEAFTEKISKAFCSSYQAIIFDFRKKYSLAGK